MRRFLLVAAVCGALLSIATPRAGHAATCEHHTVTIIWRIGPASEDHADGLKSADYNQVYCDVPHRSAFPDARVIPPGTTWVQVRSFYNVDPGPATLSGLISKRDVPMSPGGPSGGFTYEWSSPWIRLDPLARGSLTVRVAFLGESNTYHTVT